MCSAGYHLLFQCFRLGLDLLKFQVYLSFAQINLVLAVLVVLLVVLVVLLVFVVLVVLLVLGVLVV